MDSIRPTMTASIPTTPLRPQPIAGPVDTVETGRPPSLDFRKAAKVLLKHRASSEVARMWSLKASVAGSPVRGSDGTVYASITYEKPAVYAFDGESGDRRWSAPVKPNTPPLLSPDGKTILVGAEDARIHAFDAASGTPAWDIPANAPFAHPPFVGNDGNVYFPLQGSLARLDLDKHAVVQETPLQHGFEDAPVVGPNGVVYGGGHDGNIYALEPGTGNVKWTCPTGDMVRNSPVVGPDGTVYGGCIGKALYAVNPDTGIEKWRYPTPHWILASPVVGQDGTVYVPCADNFLYALDPETGNEKWKFDAKGEIRVSPVPGRDGTLYVVSDRNTVFGVQQSSGVQLWAAPASSYIHCPPAIDHRGSFFYGCNDTTLQAFTDPATEEQIALEEAALDPAAPLALEPDPTIQREDGWILVDGIKIPVRR